jgi:hypothetical protein
LPQASKYLGNAAKPYCLIKFKDKVRSIRFVGEAAGLIIGSTRTKG